MDLTAFKVTMGAQIKTFSILSKVGITESIQRGLISARQAGQPGTSRTTGRPSERPFLGLGPEMNVSHKNNQDYIIYIAIFFVAQNIDIKSILAVPASNY